ncbi:MAG TPA: hypothetical protein VN457_03180, partial [Chlamydiales bacterium]|nr:hypothetical protein [Chlamydiales bacterium]
RKLHRLELFAHRLEVTQKEMVYIRRKEAFTIHWKEVDIMNFRNTKAGYGIVVKLKNGKTIDLPFFTEHSFLRLQEFRKELQLSV